MEFLALLAVVALGALDLWLAVPVGLGLGFPPLVVGLAAGGGALLGTAGVLAGGGWIRKRWESRRAPPEVPGRRGRLQRLWDRYGVVGTGLLSPLLASAPLGAALGIALGAPGGRLLLWTGLGILIATAGLTLGATLAWAGVLALTSG